MLAKSHTLTILMKYVDRRVVNRLDVVTEEEPGTEYLEGENGKEVLIGQCDGYCEELQELLGKF